MKKILLACAFLMTGVVVAQEVEPTFEIQGNLVKATYYYENGNSKTRRFLQRWKNPWKMDFICRKWKKTFAWRIQRTDKNLENGFSGMLRL